MKKSIDSRPPAGYRYYTFFGVLFVATLLITNISAQKLIPIGSFVFTGGIFLFPLSYIFGDILTEVYGYSKTRKIIWLGFFASFLMAIYLHFTVTLPAAPGWELQESYSAVLSQVPRIVMASLIAYLVGEFFNSYVMSKLKVIQKGKNLWTRAIASTVVGQLADTIIFALIAFYGIIPNAILITTIWSGYLFKVVYEIIVSPLTVLIVNYIKKKEGVDIYDYEENYTPFKV